MSLSQLRTVTTAQVTNLALLECLSVGFLHLGQRKECV